MNPRIVIVGAGYSLSLVAFSLAKKLEALAPGIVAVDVGESDASDVTSTFSDIRLYNRELGINERDFIAKVGARVNFGCSVRRRPSEARFIFTDSPYGLTLNNVYFHQLFFLYQFLKPTAQLDDFCLSASLAKAGRFASKSEHPTSVFSTVNYGYVFESRSYERYLKSLALNHNVVYVSSPELSVKRGLAGIEHITTKSGQALDADIFIDCSSKRWLSSVLQNPRGINPLHLPYWRCSMNTHSNGLEEVRLFGDITYEVEGIRKATVHQHIVYEEVFEFSTASAKSESLENCTFLKPTVVDNAWIGNCIVLGKAYADIPGLMLESYHLLQGQLLQLLDCWPVRPSAPSTARIFNEACRQTLAQLVDILNIFLASHPAYASVVELTESNQSRLDLFQSSGALFPIDNAILPDQQWVALLYALGYRQRTGSLRAASLPIDKIVEQLEALSALIRKATDASLRYEQWIERTRQASNE